ncbi:MAG: hypothetical protein GXO26_02910 [Crenarchaeota archaeon]|nr:hypothetical protein [Thermoproteota archaeon]
MGKLGRELIKFIYVENYGSVLPEHEAIEQVLTRREVFYDLVTALGQVPIIVTDVTILFPVAYLYVLDVRRYLLFLNVKDSCGGKPSGLWIALLPDITCERLQSGDKVHLHVLNSLPVITGRVYKYLRDLNKLLDQYNNVLKVDPILERFLDIEIEKLIIRSLYELFPIYYFSALTLLYEDVEVRNIVRNIACNSLNIFYNNNKYMAYIRLDRHVTHAAYIYLTDGGIFLQPHNREYYPTPQLKEKCRIMKKWLVTVEDADIINPKIGKYVKTIFREALRIDSPSIMMVNYHEKSHFMLRRVDLEEEESKHPLTLENIKVLREGYRRDIYTGIIYY